MHHFEEGVEKEPNFPQLPRTSTTRVSILFFLRSVPLLFVTSSFHRAASVLLPAQWVASEASEAASFFLSFPSTCQLYIPPSLTRTVRSEYK